MNPVSVDIKDLLVDEGIGTFAATTGWSIHISMEPDSPDTTITIYDLGGRSPGYYANPNLNPTMYDTCQIRVRSRTYNDAYAKMKEIVDYLDQMCHFKMSGLSSSDADTYYGGLFLQGSPICLPKDEKNRTIWIANFEAVRETEQA